MNVSEAIRLKRAVRQFTDQPTSRRIHSHYPQCRSPGPILQEHPTLEFHCHNRQIHPQSIIRVWC